MQETYVKRNIPLSATDAWSSGECNKMLLPPVAIAITNQPPSFKGAPGETWDLRRRTEIIPAKDSHTRIKPFALASGHGRYMTVAPERTLVSVGEWPLHVTYSRHKFVTVSLPKRFRNGRCSSETAPLLCAIPTPSLATLAGY